MTSLSSKPLNARTAESISRLIELSSDEIAEGDLTAISALLRASERCNSVSG